jgi:hypothetical protein
VQYYSTSVIYALQSGEKSIHDGEIESDIPIRLSYEVN